MLARSSEVYISQQLSHFHNTKINPLQAVFLKHLKLRRLEAEKREGELKTERPIWL